MYKRLTVCLLAALLMLTLTPVLAKEEVPELVVANPTKLSGMFFTNLWGNNTSDIDVRTLLHGLNIVAYRGENNQAINATAVKSHNRSVDAKGNVTYTITLWDDLYFSDGSPLQAKDYVASLLLLSSPQLRQLGGAESRGYQHVQGFEAYYTGQSAGLTGVKLLDDLAFSFTIDAAYLPYYYELSLVDITPYPMAVLLPDIQLEEKEEGLQFVTPIDQAQLQEILFGEEGYVSHPKVTSGPYRLVSYNAETGEAHFERNEHFKGG